MTNMKTPRHEAQIRAAQEYAAVERCLSKVRAAINAWKDIPERLLFDGTCLRDVDRDLEAARGKLAAYIIVSNGVSLGGELPACPPSA